MPTLNEVHAPSASRPDGALRYTITPFQPALYAAPAGSVTPPASPGALPQYGNDYLQVECDSSVDIGMAVSAMLAEPFPYVRPADASESEFVIGLVVAKNSPSEAVVQTDGYVTRGLSGLIPGSSYYLSSNGGIQPPPLTGIVYAQLIGQALSETSLALANNGQVFKRQAQDDAQTED